MMLVAAQHKNDANVVEQRYWHAGGQKPSMDERVAYNGWRGGSGSGGTTTELSVTTNRMI